MGRRWAVVGLLTKGFEVEMYTGTPQGEAVGFADRIVAALPGFVREPDSRNVEYTTPPLPRYEHLLVALLKPRAQLRAYLQTLGDYTLLPGSTLALGGSDRFVRSDPQNPYHDYIEQTYGTRVVTASIHINVGIPEPELLMQACRLIRMEAALYLALSASSPFLDGQVTGSFSHRWQVFPRTPATVPLFASHSHYIDWTNDQLALGTMQNVRHLWSSVRPNGDRRPYDLNRLELRICDLVSDPVALLAITTLLELRLHQMLAKPESLDPLTRSPFTPTELAAIADRNEDAVARQGLAAPIVRWDTGETLSAADWIANQQAEVTDLARELGIACFLGPLSSILAHGPEAHRWLQAHHQGRSPTDILQTAIQTMAHQEQNLLVLL
ncbi:MAG TPA: putative glutamate--cysteine ligase [Cyanobacteria bacterium UBA8156]|nr:putative glutamate--cysteine ligase [Cyanobacteria bacterium UBA8156]